MNGRLISSVCMVALTIGLTTSIACSDDDDGGNEGSGDNAEARTTICDELDDVRGGLDDLSEAARERDTDAADDAVEEVQASASEIRSAIDDVEVSDTASEAAADFIGALDSLRTTLAQGGASAVGVIQSLEIQLPALRSAATTFQEELADVSCEPT